VLEANRECKDQDRSLPDYIHREANTVCLWRLEIIMYEIFNFLPAKEFLKDRSKVGLNSVYTEDHSLKTKIKIKTTT